jgi:hypothetical protein
MAKENEKLRGFLRTIYQQRESWKHRALAAEAGLVEASAKISNSGGRVSDFRYATLALQRSLVGSPADFSKHIAMSSLSQNLKRQSESVCASGTFHCVRLSAMILVECRAP